jgi:hypothetical protein
MPCLLCHAAHAHAHAHAHAQQVRLVDPLLPCGPDGCGEDDDSDPMRPALLTVKLNNLFPVLGSTETAAFDQRTLRAALRDVFL